jgi:hypothetical protein
MAKEYAVRGDLKTFVLSVTTGPLETLLAVSAMERINTGMKWPKPASPLQKLKDLVKPKWNYQAVLHIHMKF